MAWIAAAADYIGSFFVADTAAAGATTAAAGAGATAGAAATGTAAAGATGAAAGSAAAAGAAGGAVAGGSIATTVAEASAIATGASALYTLSQGAGRINVPPLPTTPQASIDQQVAQSEQDELRRREAAGGLQSTVGTGPGQAGAILNPSTLSQRTLLGG